MTKKYILLIFGLFLPFMALSQYYVSLNNDNTVRYKNAYLIDLPLNPGKFNINLFIQDPYRLIPEKAYNSMQQNDNLDCFDTIFISHKKQIGSIGLQQKILEKTLTEYVTKDNNYDSFYKDTLIDMDDRFSGYEKLQNKKEAGYVLIYYSENIGLGCCFTESAVKAHDEYEKKYNVGNFISRFEKRHNVKIGDIFYSSSGEGDGSEYLTLSGLTEKQKLQFLYERNNSLPPDRANKTERNQSVIYTPYWASLDSFTQPVGIKSAAELKREDEAVYQVVQKEPMYPGGDAAFVALFKNVHFNPDARTIVIFVVRKDGAVTDLKVARGGNEQVDKEVNNALNKSLKWHPGIQNGKAVNVQYAILLADKATKELKK